MIPQVFAYIPAHLVFNIASGPEKSGHARPIYRFSAEIFGLNAEQASFYEERGQNAQDEDQKRCKKEISPDRKWQSSRLCCLPKS
ncbi:hypothetical protein N8Z70_01320 [Candidatus Puniceispirillum sp.]|nr:hypothetical protein [Alphaproteobacteria bacterium]MDC1293666.1 hypothetical protein [Candidatus Puniceispirillum sp.]